ncbi:hypothetical protein PG993_008039 [Apiospora rasikravindrae]|uniref:2EXR domain-containing protein n=1 Tax=Apiospora rasikravindrae TaxID=990691 RepID=A0ABR1SZ71_9PEZI
MKFLDREGKLPTRKLASNFWIDTPALFITVALCETPSPVKWLASPNLVPTNHSAGTMETDQAVQQRSLPYIPAEIRLLIWKELVSIPRVVTIDFSRHEHSVSPFVEIDGVPYSQAPALFLVSRETRRIALETYGIRVYLQSWPGANWLLAEHDRVLLKDVGWGWHTYGWGSGKYFFSDGTREDFRLKKSNQPRHLMWRVITNFAEGPRPSGLPTEEELLSQSVADLDNERRTVARFSLRKLMPKPPGHRLVREYLDQLSEPHVVARIGAGNKGLGSGSNGVTKEYFLLEEAYAAVTRVIERPKRHWCCFFFDSSLQDKIYCMLHSSA